jgi:hypothetical protein
MLPEIGAFLMNFKRTHGLIMNDELKNDEGERGMVPRVRKDDKLGGLLKDNRCSYDEFQTYTTPHRSY